MIKRSTLPQPDDEARSIDLYCPNLKCGGTVNILKCLYRCPKSRIIRCTAYTEVYPKLLTFDVDDKYVEKYGEVSIPVPLSLRKRRKRRGLDT